MRILRGLDVEPPKPAGQVANSADYAGVYRGGGKTPSQARGADANRDAARQKAGAVDRDTAREKAQGVDRDAARQKAQAVDRDAARQRAQHASKDNALKGVNDRNAARQIDRGTASHKAAAGRPKAAKAPAAKPATAKAPAARPKAAPAKAAGAHGGHKGGRGR